MVPVPEDAGLPCTLPPELREVAGDGASLLSPWRNSRRAWLALLGLLPASLGVVGLGAPAVQAQTHAAPLPPGTYAYVTNTGSHDVSVIDTATNTVTATVGVGTSPWNIAVTPDSGHAYVTNSGSNDVSVIDIASNAVTATVGVGAVPRGVAVAPDGDHVYVTNSGAGTVSVIDTATNAVTATVSVGVGPQSVAVAPDGGHVYVANANSNSVSVIDTATNAVSPASVGFLPVGVAVAPNGGYVYVTNQNANSVSVIDTTTNSVTATVAVGNLPWNLAVTPDSQRVYVANFGSNNVSVIDTTSNTVTATVSTGTRPHNVVFTPGGQYAYISNFGSNNVSVIDTTSNTVTATVAVGTNPRGMAIATVEAPSEADVSVALTAQTSGILPKSIVYTLDITNNGPASVGSGTVTLTYPPGLYAPSSPTCSVDAAARTATCPIQAGLAAGGTDTITVSTHIGLLTVGRLTATAQAASTPVDPVPANNTATATCRALTTALASC